MQRDYYAEALSELRITVNDAGKRQAWFSQHHARAILERLDALTCHNCGEVCRGELVTRLCDECVVVSQGGR